MFVFSTCLPLRRSILHAGSRLCIFHWLSPCPTLCFRTLGDRGGLACAESFGLVPSAGEFGAPCCRTLAGGLHKHLVADAGSLLWCFAACEGPLVGLPRRGHFGSSCY